MKINTIHCFLVHPAKSVDTQPDIGGTTVPKSGKLYLMLESIFERAKEECSTEISFNHNMDGKQQNDCRDLLLDYIQKPHLPRGRKIALRLQAVTTNKSGLGLLFLMVGQENQHAKLVLSRFPADQGILAEERKDSLSVEFLEKVFMKSATSYKAVFFEDQVTTTGFWIGRAVDKQINNPSEIVARYWIRDFLASDLRTTAAAGTKRLAVALRDAISSLDDTVAKNEISAAVTLAPSLSGRTTTIDQFCDRFGLSPTTREAVRKAVRNDALMAETFQFDGTEFGRFIAYRLVELDNGATLSAESSQFDSVFSKEQTAKNDGRIRFATVGRVVDERLRKSKV